MYDARVKKSQIEVEQSAIALECKEQRRRRDG